MSVSVPITKSIWFLKADIKATVDGVDINGVVTLGCWGYCIGDNCTQTKLGYNLGPSATPASATNTGRTPVLSLTQCP